MSETAPYVGLDYFGEEDAKRLATKILRENALQFFKL